MKHHPKIMEKHQKSFKHQEKKGGGSNLPSMATMFPPYAALPLAHRWPLEGRPR